MKKFCITFLLSGIIILSALGVFSGAFGTQTAPANTEYLRIHIRANSNEGEDQAVKYLVRDAVVAYLTPIVAEAETREEAEAALDDCLPGLVKTAEQVLEKNGFFYGARAEIREEEVPTRVYGDYTLEAGVYRALIVSLGTGTGDNWWCVVYPPLCFAGEPGDSIVYRSKILEIIRNWKKNH